MDVPLRADGLPAQPPSGISHRAVEQVALEHRLAVAAAAHVHGNGIDGIGALAVGVAQAFADRVQRAQLHLRTEHAGAVGKAHRLFRGTDVESGMDHLVYPLTYAFTVAHFSPVAAGRMVYFPTAAGMMKVSA